MANGINNKEQNVIEFSPISVYGEQEEDNVLKKLSKQLFDVVNEPKDPYEVGRYFPWNKQIALQEFPSISTQLKDFVTGPVKVARDLIESPFSVADLMFRQFASNRSNYIPGSKQDDYIGSIKKAEAEEAADWMKFWFNSPYTKERLKDMGRTDEEVEEIVSQASNIEGMSFEEISKRSPDDNRNLAFVEDYLKDLEDRSFRKKIPPDASAWYDPDLHYTAVYPKTANSVVPYLLGKDPYISKNIHEFAHGVMRDDKLTEKELSILNESEKVSDFPDDKFIEYVSDPEGPFRPYVFKNQPYTFGPQGAWKERRPREGFGMNPKYFNDPGEIYSRIFELRRHLDAKPGEFIDVDDIEKIKHYPAVNDLLRYIPIKEVHKLVNTLASNRKIEDKLIDSFSFEDDIFKKPNLT